MLEFKSKVLTIIISLVIMLPLFAWEKYYGTDADEDGRSVQQTEEGYYIIGGTTIHSDNNMEAYLAHIDNNGNLIWNYTYGCPESLEILCSVEQTPNYGFVAVGEVWPPNPIHEYAERGLIVKTDYDGNLDWIFHKTEGFRTFSSFNYIPEEDSICVTGWIITGGNIYSILWAKYGPIDWGKNRGPGQGGTEQYYHYGQHNEGHCMHQVTDNYGNIAGYVIVGGIWYENIGSDHHQNCDAYLLRIDQKGENPHLATFGNSYNDEIAYFIVPTFDDGGYIIVGGARAYDGIGGWDVYLAKVIVDQWGNISEEWEKTYGGAKDDIGYSVQQTPDSGYIICGSTQSFSADGSEDLFITRVDAEGNQIFTKTFGKPQTYDYGYTIEKTNNNGYIIAGTERYGGEVPINRGDEVYCIYEECINPPTLKCFNPVVYGGVYIHWGDNSTNEDGFDVYRKIGTVGSYIKIGSVGANMTAYFDDDIESHFGQELYYRIRAVSDSWSSDASNELIVKIPSNGIFSDTIRAIDYDHSSKNLYRDNNGNYHLVLKHVNRLWYTKSTDNGQTWSLARNLAWTGPEIPSVVATSTGLPCFVWQEKSGSAPNFIYDLVYAYIDASGNICKMTLVDNADHNLSPATAITTDDNIFIAFVYTYAQNSAGKIASLKFNYNNPQPYPNAVIFEFNDCDHTGNIRIARDDQNNLHLVWREDYTVWGGNPYHAAQVGQIFHGLVVGTTGTRESVATGWITDYNTTYNVGSPEIVAISSQTLKCIWGLRRTYPSSNVSEVFYRAKINGAWQTQKNCTEDPVLGDYPGLARIIRSVVLCLSNNKIYATYPTFAFETAVLAENVINYDAMPIPSEAFMGTAAIVYSTNTSIPDFYKICFTIKTIPHILPYQQIIVYSMPPGPPPEFTAYNNARRFLKDTNGILHLAFTSGDNVYHSFLQDTSWSEPVLIGGGKYPSLSLAPDGNIYCTWSFHGYKKFGGLMYYVEYLYLSSFNGTAWSAPNILFHTYGTFLWGVGAPSMAINDTMAYVTFKSYHGPFPNPAPGTQPPQIVVVEGPALIYGTFPLNNPVYSCTILDSIIKTQTPVDTLTYRDSLVPLLISPSVTVDMAGIPHILWKGDSTMMRYYTITGAGISEDTFDAGVDFPHLGMNGDKIDLFWTANDSVRYRYGWTGTTNLSQTQTIAECESPFSSNQYLTWTKNDGNLSHFYYGTIPASGAIEPVEINYSTDLIGYPQLVFNPEQQNQSASLDLVWTEYSYIDSLGYIYYLNLRVEAAPIYAFDMGTEIPVPVCLQRDGYLAYGSEDFQTIDYDSTVLIYQFTLHSPHKKYKIRWTYYHQETGNLKLGFSIDDILHHNRWVEPGEKVVEETWIPQACLDDNAITISVKRLKGTLAVLSGMEIEAEEVGGGGGPQGNALPYTLDAIGLMPIYPNPAKGVIKIRFNTPDKRKVTIKLYDVMGRFVGTVFDGSAKSGTNEILLNPMALSTGIYFVNFESHDYNKVEKIILLR